MKEQLVRIVVHLLKQNRISFHQKELEFQIKSHPSYPSLHSITGVLDHFNIENVAAQVEVEELIIEQLPYSFIAQLNDHNSKKLVTIKRDGDSYIINDGVQKSYSLTKEGFIDKFTGIVVAVERSGLNNTKKDYSSFHYIASLTLIALLALFFSVDSQFNITDYAFTLLSFLGVVVSAVIVQQELGLQTKMGDAFCSDNANNKNCDAVLTSDGAKLLKFLKLSDASLIYFIFLSISSFVLPRESDILNLTSIIVLPFILFSIYYQYQVVKSWCMLCLTIAGIMFVQGVMALVNIESNYLSHMNSWIPTILIYLIILFTWKMSRPKIEELLSLRNNELKAIKFKRNFNLFKRLLLDSKRLNTSIDDIEEIQFGTGGTNTEIVVITNPFCGFCKPVHEMMDKLLDKFGDEVNITIRFNININDPDSDLVGITSRILEIYNRQGKEECMKAINEIYSDRNPKEWILKWGKCNEKENYINTLSIQKQWCTNNNINFTPQILVNGYSYPSEYDKEDLFVFMDDLIELSKIKSPKQKVLD